MKSFLTIGKKAAGLDRHAIQHLLQRRSNAKRNILSGSTHLHLEGAETYGPAKGDGKAEPNNRLVQIGASFFPVREVLFKS